ncbi:DUF429 domain-containing protein [Clostridium sp. YIM B02505]|uniref:DUF429 domain-containing protein n=1 Tax=Clostridium yunnanense TaxID=2800325 RepID=A0ABS1EUT0_9CLOT|nr:DUF429 domain-containing protein [Clostridium yunnanense]MBK1813142.1 DUF429 domain-containing protein [Clostridium yunnanense]
MKFIGIDVHLRSTVTAVIDEYLNIIEVKNLSLEETVDKVLEYKPQIVSIDAPSGLNTGLMNDENYRAALGRKINGHYNKKVSEYELSRRGINPFPTPDSIEKVRLRNDLSWMEKGLWLYEVLKEKNYILLNQDNYMDNRERGLVEVFPHASFSVLAGQLPFNKNTEEGLNQRYLLLKNTGISNLEDILSNAKKKDKDDFLDSIAAAYTGYLIYKDLGSFVGDVMEGQIGLPDKMIRDSYKRMKK